MHRVLTGLLIVTTTVIIPTPLIASGSVQTSRRPSDESLQGVNSNLHTERSAATTTSQSKVVIADEPYNLGKALFSGQYNFSHPRLTAANAAEKKLRLVSLQRALPVAERGKMNPPDLSKQLTDREMNALEYYLGERFGLVIAKAPSWAKKEPPPKVASAP